MRSILGNQRGQVLILFAFCLPIFVAVAALAITPGWLSVGSCESQNAADAASLGGASALYGDYLPRPEMVHGDPVAVANELVGLNRASVSSIQWGHWNGTAFTAMVFLEPPPDLNTTTVEALMADPGFVNAVRVVTAVDKVGFFYPATYTLTKEAIAAVQLAQAEDGGVNILPGSRLVK